MAGGGAAGARRAVGLQLPSLRAARARARGPDRPDLRAQSPPPARPHLRHRQLQLDGRGAGEHQAELPRLHAGAREHQGRPARHPHRRHLQQLRGGSGHARAGVSGLRRSRRLPRAAELRPRQRQQGLLAVDRRQGDQELRRRAVQRVQLHGQPGHQRLRLRAPAAVAARGARRQRPQLDHQPPEPELPAPGRLPGHRDPQRRGRLLGRSGGDLLPGARPGQAGSLRCALLGHVCGGQPVHALQGLPLHRRDVPPYERQANETNSRLINVKEFVDFVKAVKGGNEDKIIVSSIIGYTGSPRRPTVCSSGPSVFGGTELDLQPACSETTTGAASPGLRLEQFTKSFRNNTVAHHLPGRPQGGHEADRREVRPRAREHLHHQPAGRHRPGAGRACSRTARCATASPATRAATTSSRCPSAQFGQQPLLGADRGPRLRLGLPHHRAAPEQHAPAARTPCRSFSA